MEHRLFIQAAFPAATMGVSFATSGLFSLPQLSYFIIGTYLGTSLTPFLFVIQEQALALALLAIGGILVLLSVRPKWTALGEVVFSLGLAYLGFQLIASTLAVIPASLVLSFWPDSLIMLRGFWGSFIVGVLAFLLVRWRSPLIVLITLLYAAGFVIGRQSLGFMLGADFGFAVTLYLAAQQGNITARRGAVVNLLAVGLFIGVLLPIRQDILQVNTHLVAWLGAFEDLSLASGAIIFIPTLYLFLNILFAVLASIICPLLQTFSKDLLRSVVKKEPHRLQLLGQISHLSAALAIELVHQELCKMANMVSNILRLTLDVAETKNDTPLNQGEKIIKYEEITDRVLNEIMDSLEKLMGLSLTEAQGRKIRSMVQTTFELEKIADSSRAIYHRYSELRQFNTNLSLKVFEFMAERLRQVVGEFEIAISWLKIDQKDLSKSLTKWSSEQALARVAHDAQTENLQHEVTAKLMANLQSMKRIHDGARVILSEQRLIAEL